MLETMKDYLESQGIATRRRSNQWLNICCPFCIGKSSGSADFDFRLGINEAEFYHCFRCSRTGNTQFLLQELVGLSESEYTKIFTEGQLLSEEPTDTQIANIFAKKEIEQKEEVEVILPGTPVSHILGVFGCLDKFIESRGFNIDMYERAGCRYCGSGRYAGRLIFPIYYKGELVSFQARDVTGKKKPKFDSLGGVNIHSYTYCLEESSDIIVVEGMMDAWRTGAGANALFGKEMTKKQRNILTTKLLCGTSIVFALDGDAKLKSMEYAEDMAIFGKPCGYADLSLGQDPDSVGRDTLLNSVKWL